MTQIDTSRRGFLKSAVAASAAMMSAAAVHAGIPAKSVAKYDETFDVVIIGSGFAGMACALKAGRAGLKVLMIEKMSTVGGNSAICGGNVACPVNPVQKAQGIKDSKELFIADCLKDGLGINHTNLLSTIADRCNDTIQMVVDCGCEFVPNKMLFEGGHSVPRSYEIKAGTGSGYIRPMHEELKKLKNVVIRTRCKFDDFVMEEDGSVAGIVCRTGYRFNNKAVSDDLENKTGKKSVVRATKGVMLAAGGFSRDIFFRQIQDPRVVPTTDSTNQPGATSESWREVSRIGARVIQADWIQCLPSCSPLEKGMGKATHFASISGSLFGFWLSSLTGERFVNEFGDRKVCTDAILTVINKGGHALALSDSDGVAHLEKLRPGLFDQMIAEKTVVKYEDAEALAKAYEMDPEVLKKTIAQYNDDLAKQSDPKFGRRFDRSAKPIGSGPYFVSEMSPKVHHCMGGVATAVDTAVLDVMTDKPIPGLFAAGEFVGGIHGAVRIGACAVMDCLVNGREAGRMAAQSKAWF